MTDGMIYLFTSHAWTYLHMRDGFHALLEPAWVKGRDFVDLSVTPRHPLNPESDYDLAAQLRDRIEASDVFLVTAGMYVNDREWIEFEIHMAFALRRPIIPVAWNGQERFPTVVTRFATCEPVRWRGDSLRDAIFHHLPYDRQVAFNARRARESKAFWDALNYLIKAATPVSHPTTLLTGGLWPPK